MKNYRKTRTLTSAATSTAPVYFKLDHENDPAIGTKVALVYGHDGKYLGFTSDLEAIHKYLYGQLYYKTNRAYRVHSNRGYSARDTKKICINNRTDSRTALYIQIRKIDSDDLVDVDNINSTAELTLQEVERFEPSNWSYDRYPDKYNLLKDGNFAAKFRNEFDEMVKRQKQEVIAYLNAKRDAQNGLNDLAMFRMGNKKMALVG